MSIFGDLERALADLYPYRIPLTLGGLAVAAALGWFVMQRGWHRPALGWIAGNRLPSTILAVVFVAVTVPTGYYLLSPLWERTTLIEASPLDSATVADLGAGAGSASATPAEAGAATATPTAPSTDGVAAGAAGGPQLVSQGSFAGADDFHFAEGSALIVETEPGTFVLRFEDFSIRNGPDLFVYLSSDPDAPSADGIRLGELKATDGAFNYEIPAGLDITALRYAMVWCDQFSVLFATAGLNT